VTFRSEAMISGLAEHIDAREKALTLALRVVAAGREVDHEAADLAALGAMQDEFAVACDEVGRTARDLPLARRPKGLRRS
jgi:hypothetical protein